MNIRNEAVEFSGQCLPGEMKHQVWIIREAGKKIMLRVFKKWKNNATELLEDNHELVQRELP